MRYQIASRIEEVLSVDKFSDPQHLCDVLQEEIQPIADNYLALDGDVKVRYRKDGDKNIFFIEMSADRIKPFGYLPG